MKFIYLLSLTFFFSLSAYAQIITTIAGDSTAGYNGDNIPAIDAELFAPIFVTPDGLGNFYISDWENFRIRKVNSSGVITTIAGIGISGFSGDGGSATNAKISGPEGLKIDKAGNLYFADCANARVRRIDNAGIITTIAGTGHAGFSGDGGQATAAQLNNPHDVAIDDSGNVYITEYENSCVRKVNTNGIISTIAGMGGIGGNSGDGGPATAATLGSPYGITLDGLGDIYIADYNNNNIRKINASGIISTIAGTETYGYNGDGIEATTAKLYGPCGVAVDSSGNLYVADGYNRRIRKISPATGSGIISTVAGDGITGYSGDGGMATLAEINPTGVALDNVGSIYIADFNNSRIRYIKNTLAVNSSNYINDILYLYPNPNSGSFTLSITSGMAEQAIVTIMNTIGEKIKEVIVYSNEHTELRLNVPPGVYFITATTTNKSMSGRVVIIK